MRKITNKRQIEKLVSIMKCNPEIAKGLYRRSKIQAEWEKYADELNSLGPPVRSGEKWLKVWADFKCNIKRKLTHNTKELKGTGGGPNNLQHFTELEEEVINLINLRTYTNPPGRSFGMTTDIEEAATITNEDEQEENILVDMSNDVIVESTQTTCATTNLPTTSTPSQRRTIRRTILGPLNNERMTLLERQTKSMEDFNTEMINNMREIKEYQKQQKDDTSEIKKFLKEISEYKKKIYYLKKDKKKEMLNIKKDKLHVYKEEVKQKQRDRAKKLELKMQILELKQQERSLRNSLYGP